MEPDEQKIRKALETMADGGSYDYAAVQGGIVVFDKESKRVNELENLILFLTLRERGLIGKQITLHNWHPIFHPSYTNPVDVYNITEEGKKYLEKN